MAESEMAAPTLVDEASEPFLGRWNRLVSTTNWEKGRIIFQWRDALKAAGAPPAEFSDDAWSTRVGGVTGQHVGRLRRVFERFDAVREQYPRLFWSHFQAGLDWNDAEMWLEGAVQNDWSVAHMRRQRAETLGLVEAELDAAADQDQTIDEDSGVESDARQQSAVAINGSGAAIDPRHERSASDHSAHDRNGIDDANKELGDEDDAVVTYAEYETAADQPADGGETPATFRPFAHLAELPDDLHDAFEAMKLAVLRHKLAQWQDIARSDVVAAIDALRQLALAEE